MTNGGTTRRTVAIHQPNFFPWLGYFHKIARSDAFVFLNDVEFSKGSYTNRAQILTGGKQKWLSMPIQYKSSANIEDIQIGQGDWVDQHKRMLLGAYRKASEFDAVFPIVERLYDSADKSSVGAFNVFVIEALASQLNLETEFHSSSRIDAPGKKEEKLCSIIVSLGGNQYLSGQGGQKYQSEEAYSREGIDLTYTTFSARPYPQLGETFTPGLSILDALFNVGLARTRELITEIDHA